MKMVKSLILGSAAAVVAMSGAQAADLPVKAKAVEYVRICSLYGAGFYYIPGTDTCIKLGGYLRVETALNTNSVYGLQNGSPAGAHNQLANYYTARSREDFNIDTRTATEYGVVRTYFDATFSWTTGGYLGTGNTPGSTVYTGAAAALNSGGALIGGIANPNDGGTSGGSLGVYHAFIQFAGFTMGKTISQFDAPWQNYPANNFDGLVGGSGMVTGVNQFTYTYNFGNGVSGTLSAQDVVAYGQAGVQNLTGLSTAGMQGGAYGVNNIAGTRSPDLIAVLKVSQAWGTLQGSAVAHINTPGYYGATEVTGTPNDKWGWAVQVAGSFNVPTGAGDTLNLQAVYTDGASRYNFQNLVGSSFSMYGGSSTQYGSIGFANAPDAVYTGTTFANGSQLETVKTWGFRGGFNHNWDPYWNTGIYGAYASAQYGGLAKATICGPGGFIPANQPGVTSCNPDFNIYQAGIITRWTPVKNLTFSADFVWTRIDQKYAGVWNAAQNNTSAKPGGAIYELKDQDSFNLLLRAQRNW